MTRIEKSHEKKENSYDFIVIWPYDNVTLSDVEIVQELDKKINIFKANNSWILEIISMSVFQCQKYFSHHAYKDKKVGKWIWSIFIYQIKNLYKQTVSTPYIMLFF